MQLALRPYVTAGVAIVGASVIAVTPVIAPPPEVHVANITLAANPFAPYADLINNTVASTQALVSQFVANPAPILKQFLLNQQVNFDILATVPPGIVAALQSTIDSLPGVFETAGQQVRDGQLDQAIMTLWEGAILIPIVGIVFPVLNTLEIPVNMAKTFARVVEALPTAVLIGIGFPVLFTVNSAVQAVANVVQSVFTGISSGNPLDALTAVINAPAVILDGILNGINGGPGLINGVLSGVLIAANEIANAMAPPVPVPFARMAVAPDDIAALPATANFVNVSLDESATVDAAESSAGGEGTGESEGGAVISDEEVAEEEVPAEEVAEEEVPADEEAPAEEEIPGDEIPDDEGTDETEADETEGSVGGSDTDDTAGSGSSDASDGSATGTTGGTDSGGSSEGGSDDGGSES